MGFIDRFKVRLWKAQMRKAKKRNIRQKRMTSFNRANTVGLYYQFEDAQQQRTIHNFIHFLKTKGIKVAVLTYKDKKVEKLPIAHDNQAVYASDELKFNLTPKNQHAQEFIYQKFDMFIDMSMQEHFQNLYVAQASRSGLKIGLGTENGLEVFDFCFSLPPDSSLNDYIDNIIKYIESFKEC